ncbi:hypothetical protein E5675_01170 [Sphingopyxis sp. PAMC25046]|uniref:hypothetical protein n=1 Tax=Sphingopyxis sp. PAMC25046 TaxID=2565556 RepID=UPI00109DA36E|nr:hypothetical protein [Sphingopyxis sp. PAMC25046]QCB53187.1 hypothetical protein E5675_01170 [Sphingopyxis sp. PAMC25046]
MTALGWAAAALLASAAPAAGAPSLAAWHGSWVGEGEAFGKPATATLEIAPGEGGATTLAYRLRIERTPPVTYSAEASYTVDAKGRVRGKWTDSTGRTRAIAGGVNAAKWWTHWGSADVEIGRSTYVLKEGGRLLVSDSVLREDGSWHVFAVLRYTRKNP